MNTLLQGHVCLFAIWISKYCTTHVARSMPRVERQGWTNNHWSMADSHNTVRVSISLVKEMGVSKDGSSNIAGGVTGMNSQWSRGNSNNTMGFSIPLLPSCNQGNWSASVASRLETRPNRCRPMICVNRHCHRWMGNSHNTMGVSISLVKEVGVSKDGSSDIAGGVAGMNGQWSRGNSNNTMGFSIPLFSSCNQSNWSASVARGLYSGTDRRRPLVGRNGHCSQHMWVGSWPG